MPANKTTGKKLADMMYGNPEGAAFGVYPQAGKRGQRKPTAKEQLQQIFADDRAMELPQFGEVDLSVPTSDAKIPGNNRLAERMLERQVDLKRQADEAMSPLEKLAGGMQTARLMGSGMYQAAKSIPTAITKGGKAAEDYIAENIYKPTQPKAYEYAEDVGNFLSSLETDYKIPPILPETIALQNVVGPAARQAGRAAQQGARQGALNIMAPRTLNPQAGAIVYHGSPHRFDKFSSKKIGTGEGAQAYGYGLYFAESPEVAKSYQPRSPKFEQKLIDLYQRASSKSNYPMMEVLEDAMMHRTPDEITQKFANVDDGYTGQHAKAAQDFVDWYSKNEPEVGGLYTVDLPDEKIAKMLDYDQPLSAQSPEVRRVLMEHPDVLDHIAKAEGQRAKLNEMSPVRLEKIPSASVPYDENRMAGKDVITAIARRSGLGKSPGAIEEELRQLGIPGIRYLDEQSRGTTGTGKWRIKLPSGEEKIYNFKPDDDVLELMKATAEPHGARNFVVFPGEEEALSIIDRKAEGGRVHISDNPDVMQMELAGGGAVAKLARLARAPAKTKAEIDAIAQRLAPQVTGEYVRESAKSAKTVAGKTQKQFQREKTLPVDVRATGEERIPKAVDIEKLKGEVMIGIPGDPTLAGKTLHGVGDTTLESPSPQHGGPLYGLHAGDEGFWASGLGAARRVQNLAREAGQQYDAPVLGKYIMMGPDSINYAQHFADANLQAIDLSKMTKKQVDQFNELIRKGNPKSGPRPNFPGIEDKGDAYLQMAIDPELRKHFNELMQKNTVTEALNLPSGIDIRFAITEPELRDLETGVTGFSVGRMRPEIPSTSLKLSEHPTYSHDIPGEFLGQSRFPLPYELSFPDTLKSIRENPKQAPHEFGSLKMVGPRQTIDQQMIDEIKAYEERMRQLTGKKKGGAVHKAAGGEITADDLILEERKL